MLTLPRDFLGRAVMWLCFRFQQVVAWKTNLGDQTRHMMDRAPILYPL